MEKEKNNTSCICCLKPYVRNHIFERKTILEKILFKKIKLKILHEKNWIRKTNKNCIFCQKPYVKNGIFERKTILEKNLFKKIIKLKILHEKKTE